MQARFKEAVESYANGNLSEIKDFSKWFAKMVTVNIMERDFTKLQELCKYAVLFRDEVEFTDNINKGKEYFFGYFFAYENMARKLSEDFQSDQKIAILLSTYEYLKKIVIYLGRNTFAQHGELASCLGISASHLSNIFKKPQIEEANIFTSQKVGRNVIYSLTPRGKQYYDTHLDDEGKLLCKKDVVQFPEAANASDLSPFH